MRITPTSNRRIPYLVGLLVAAAVIATFFEFQRHIFVQMQFWAEEGTYLTEKMRLEINLARVWKAFWWLYSPLIVGVCLGFAFLYSVLRNAISWSKYSPPRQHRDKTLGPS